MRHTKRCEFIDNPMFITAGSQAAAPEEARPGPAGKLRAEGRAWHCRRPGADDSPPRVVLSCAARPEDCARESAASSSACVRWRIREQQRAPPNARDTVNLDDGSP
jgi:hypothetical protein